MWFVKPLLNRRSAALLAALLVMFAFVGCRKAPVYNVIDAPVLEVPGKDLSLAEMQEAIVRAGAGLGWNMAPVEDGHIVGTLNLRAHQAVVDVFFNTKTYSIKYKNSRNLKYDGVKIHSNYNGWVTNLDRAIKKEMSQKIASK